MYAVRIFWHEACRCWYWSADEGLSWYSSAAREYWPAARDLLCEAHVALAFS